MRVNSLNFALSLFLLIVIMIVSCGSNQNIPIDIKHSETKHNLAVVE